jgi:hypothetical protein
MFNFCGIIILTNKNFKFRKTIFPESVNVCFNSKQQFSLVKVAFPNGTIQKIYVYDKEPLFFQSSEENAPLYPTGRSTFL